MMTPGGPYSAGTTVTYSCNSGFQLLGLETIACTSDGTWSKAVENAPLCVPDGELDKSGQL